MKFNSIRKQLTLLAGAAALVTAGGVQADATNGIVDTWNISVVGQFLCGTAAFTPGTNNTSCTPSTMNWGTSTGSGQSGLDLVNGVGGATIDTNGPAVANVQITHRNQPITGNSLDKVSLQSTLMLTPNTPAGPGSVGPVAISFLIDFLETVNHPNSGNCAGGGTDGNGINSAGCADIFVIDQTSLNFPFMFDLGAAGGNKGPQQYFISFFEETAGLNPLPPIACTNTVGYNPCLGFRTAEGQNTTFRFAAVITTRPVSIPVPGTLAAMGLGLLLLGAMRRRVS